MNHTNIFRLINCEDRSFQDIANASPQDGFEHSIYISAVVELTPQDFEMFKQTLSIDPILEDVHDNMWFHDEDYNNEYVECILIKSTESQDGMLYFRGNCCFIPNAQLLDASDAKRIVYNADRYPQEPRNSSRNAASQQKSAGKRPRKGQAR